ncbi:hypothetical protein [Zhongshania sp.]|uniref:hypothetical protein n=1 Tax=Zhongshania sp. TaxID=1971902 RepID=UPI0035674F25
MSKKDAYVAKGQATIDEQIAKLDMLKAKVKSQVADQRIDAHEHIEKLEKKLATAKLRLAEVANSAEDKWEDLSARFDELSDDLSATVKKFFSK